MMDFRCPPKTARAATPHQPILLRETLGGIAMLTLNREEARTSLSEAPDRQNSPRRSGTFTTMPACGRW